MLLAPPASRDSAVALLRAVRLPMQEEQRLRRGKLTDSIAAQADDHAAGDVEGLHAGIPPTGNPDLAVRRRS